MAAISSSIGLLIYLTDYSILFDWKFMLIMWTIGAVVVITLGRKLLRPKDYVGLSYGEALKYLFVAYLVSSLISSVFQIAVYGNNQEFKTDYIQYSKDANIATLEWGLNLTGLSEAEIEMEVDKLKDQWESGETPEPMFPYQWSFLHWTILGAIVLSLILSLIFAIFIKQKG